MSEGLHRKYDVRKVDDPTGKHNHCRFVVLDLDHDPHARTALLAYYEAAGRPNWVAVALDQWRSTT